MKTFKLLLAVFAIAALVYSCSSDKSDDSKSEGNITNGKDLGKAIGDDYLQSTKELEEILKKDLPLDDLRTAVNDLKEKYIKIFVAYGKQKEKLDSSEKVKCDQVLWDVMVNADIKRFDFINSKASPIGEQDWELFQTIASMNVITQYADFELLKKQNPEEAERLEIK
jgi:hypothetical protein